MCIATYMRIVTCVLGFLEFVGSGDVGWYVSTCEQGCYIFMLYLEGFVGKGPTVYLSFCV